MRQKKGLAPLIIDFRLTLARSNPMVMREISIPDTYTAEEFTDAVCISFGLQPAEAELKVEGGCGNTVYELFSQNDRGLLMLPRNTGKNRVQLCFYVDMIGSEESVTEMDIPDIKYYTDLNIPADIWDVRDVNTVLIQLVGDTSAVAYGNNIYYKNDLLFSIKKTENALRRRFAPRTAQKEVNSTVTLPMRDLIGSQKLDVLKRIAEKYGIYYYSGMRKAEIVERICRHYDKQYIAELFEMMTITEYQKFREYILDESDKRLDNAVEKDLALFIKRGIISFVGEKGFCIASEVAEYFESFFDTDEEAEFIKIKYLKSAIKVCAELYGIFDMDMYDAVLKAMNAEDIDEKEKRDYFYAVYKGKGMPELFSAEPGIWCYRSNDIRKDRILEIYANRYMGGGFYVPDEDHINDILKNGLGLSRKGTMELKGIIEKYGYRSYYNEYSADRLIMQMAESIHWGEKTEKTLTIMDRALFRFFGWGSRGMIDSLKNNVRVLIGNEAKTMPLVGLNGYSLKNCPEEILRYYKPVR